MSKQKTTGITAFMFLIMLLLLGTIALFTWSGTKKLNETKSNEQEIRLYIRKGLDFFRK